MTVKAIGLLASALTANILLFHYSAHGAAKTLVYCSEGSPTSFNPQIAGDGTTLNAARPIYDQLVNIRWESGEIVPALAESWRISGDGLVYTFKLRQGVAFHKTRYFEPTRNFNADDVIFSLHRQWKKEHPYHRVGGGNYPGVGAFLARIHLRNIKKIDSYTVEISLKKPFAPLLASMSIDPMSILSKEYADQLQKQGKPEQIDYRPIGTGAFVFEKYIRDSTIRYRINNNFWRKKAKVNLAFVIAPEASIRYQKLKVGECHLIVDPPISDLEKINSNKELRVLKTYGSNISYLAMNTKKKPFDNVLVRRAINHALNKSAYIKSIYLGDAKTAKNPFPPAIWGYSKETVAYEYDPEKARSLLAKAGYRSGFTTTMWVLPMTRPYNPNGKKMGEMMQADLAAVGIKTKLLTYDWASYIVRSRKGIHPLIQFGWSGDSNDPDNFLYPLLSCNATEHGGNKAFWCNKNFDTLISRAHGVQSKGKRKRLYIEAQEIFHREAPWVPIAHAVVYRALSRKVKGYKIHPMGREMFESVYIK